MDFSTVRTTYGTSGNDEFTVTGNEDEVIATLGDRSITFNRAVISEIKITAGAGNDKIEILQVEAAMSVYIDAGDGNDTVFAGLKSDTILCGEGNDLVYGATGNDLIKGNGGDDTMYGEPGADRIYGGSGNDLIVGGDATDQLYGEAGNDRLEGKKGNDLIHGGSGTDTAVADDNDSLVTSIEILL